MARNDKDLNPTDVPDKKVVLAMLLAVFGILLFIALALTLPWI